MIRALPLLLLLACNRSSDTARFTALMESNERLVHSLTPATPPTQAHASIATIVENLRAASTLKRDAKLLEQFSRTLADLQPLPGERYNPGMIERLRASCLECHARFKE